MNELEMALEKAEYYAHQIGVLNALLQHQIEGVGIIKRQIKEYSEAEMMHRAEVKGIERLDEIAKK
jgi:hypothetical protein